VGQWLKQETALTDVDILGRLIKLADDLYAAKVELVGAEVFHQFERNVMLQSLDVHWREHLGALDHLRQGIHLRGYAQKNPKQEYKREAFELFENLLDIVRREVTKVLVTVQVRTQSDVEEAAQPEEVENVQYHHAGYDEVLGEGEAQKSRPAHADPKVGRNDPCPCGSGKKYKHCHGKLA
jgi:preprotein translocase subunit SecA